LPFTSQFKAFAISGQNLWAQMPWTFSFTNGEQWDFLDTY